MSKALEDIAAERQRQISVEGWTPEHDDAHGHGDMAAAASCYAVAASETTAGNSSTWDQVEVVADFVRALWPWDWSWWKPSDQRRNLVKAGALIVAEIERLDRLAANQS